MAIQNRRGEYKDFDPDKMLPGEIAIVTSGDPNSKTGANMYVCFAAGNVKAVPIEMKVISGGGGTGEVPTMLAQLMDDTEHRTVTDKEKETWNGKADQIDVDRLREDLDKCCMIGIVEVDKSTLEMIDNCLNDDGSLSFAYKSYNLGNEAGFYLSTKNTPFVARVFNYAMDLVEKVTLTSERKYIELDGLGGIINIAFEEASVDDLVIEKEGIIDTSEYLNSLNNKIDNKANKSGYSPNKYLGSDEDGNLVEKDAPDNIYDWAKQPTKPSYTANEVGADPSGTAASKVAEHNTSADSHNDIRLLIQNLAKEFYAFADSDDETLDQASEFVAYIKANRSLIESITTSKVSVTDIVDDYVTNVSNKPVSAAVTVKLKALIDAITVPTKLSELSGDATHRTVTDTEKKTWNEKLGIDQLSANNVINALGYTPIQQGGGTDQKTNKIYIGWTGSKLNAQVDASNMGAIALESWVNELLGITNVSLTTYNLSTTGKTDYVCQYIPHLGICFLRGYLTFGVNGNADTDLSMWQLPGTYKPRGGAEHVLHGYFDNTQVIIKLRQNGTTGNYRIYVNSPIAISSGKTIYVTGFWFV